MRYVAISTDANPIYAIYAPIVVRLWRRLSYEPILVVHSTGWGTPFGQLVRDELNAAGCKTIELPRMEPLTVANTMRVSRIVVPSMLTDPDDLVMTSDADMAPISRTWFNQELGEVFVLRADMYGPFSRASLQHDGSRALISGHWKFPMCYIGMKNRIWHELFPLVPNDPDSSLRRVLHGLNQDSPDFDEATISARLLLSRYAVGSLAQNGDFWQQGSLRMVGMSDWVKRDGWPMAMCGAGGVLSSKEAVIDFHMPKGVNKETPTILAKFWPEEADFIHSYWSKAVSLKS